MSDAVRESVAGWRAGDVAATAKHFPGLGAAPANTDRAIVTIGRSRAHLMRVDLAPFRAAIAAGVPQVMVGHARYPHSIARASLETGGVARASQRALRAGAGLLLLTGRDSYAPVYRHLLAAARLSPALRSRVREAAARVLLLRARGPLPPR